MPTTTQGSMTSGLALPYRPRCDIVGGARGSEQPGDHLCSAGGEQNCSGSSLQPTEPPVGTPVSMEMGGCFPPLPPFPSSRCRIRKQW